MGKRKKNAITITLEDETLKRVDEDAAQLGLDRSNAIEGMIKYYQAHPATEELKKLIEAQKDNTLGDDSGEG